MCNINPVHTQIRYRSARVFPTRARARVPPRARRHDWKLLRPVGSCCARFSATSGSCAPWRRRRVHNPYRGRNKFLLGGGTARPYRGRNKFLLGGGTARQLNVGLPFRCHDRAGTRPHAHAPRKPIQTRTRASAVTRPRNGHAQFVTESVAAPTFGGAGLSRRGSCRVPPRGAGNLGVLGGAPVVQSYPIHV